MTSRPLGEALADDFKTKFKDSVNLAEILANKMKFKGKFRAEFKDKANFKAILAGKFKGKTANSAEKTKEAFFKANAGTALRGEAFYTPSSRARM